MPAQTLHPSDTVQLARRNRELSILNNIAEALNRSVELDQALQTTLERAVELFELQTGWVWLLTEGSDETYLAAAHNLPPGLANYPERMQGSCYCLDTYQAGDLSGAANVSIITCSRLKKLVDGTGGLRYHASVPLYAHGKKLGVLNVTSPDWRELTADDLRLLYTVGDMLGIAIERARLFARSIELGAADERNRLAREIHDTLAQSLAGIVLQLETAEALLESNGDPAKINRATRQALELGRAGLEEARRSVLDLRAVPLEGRTLVQALEHLAGETRHTSGLNIELVVIGGERPLPTHVETGLYRIAQEALANIAQHAQARQARLELSLSPHQVRLSIRDDGLGFDPASLPPGRFGLIGLSERARLLGGRLLVDSAPGKGAHLEVNLPLNA